MQNVILLDHGDINTRRNFNHFEIHTSGGPIINLTREAVIELYSDLKAFLEELQDDKPSAIG